MPFILNCNRTQHLNLLCSEVNNLVCIFWCRVNFVVLMGGQSVVLSRAVGWIIRCYVATMFCSVYKCTAILHLSDSFLLWSRCTGIYDSSLETIYLWPKIERNTNDTIENWYRFTNIIVIELSIWKYRILETSYRYIDIRVKPVTIAYKL